MAGRFWEASPGRVWVGRLETGDDLVEEIERVCAESDVRAAWVSAIGAVKRAAFAYYEQDDRRYLELESSEHHEIVGFIGNISIRDVGRSCMPTPRSRAGPGSQWAATPPGMRGIRGGDRDPRDDRGRARSDAR